MEGIGMSWKAINRLKKPSVDKWKTMSPIMVNRQEDGKDTRWFAYTVTTMKNSECKEKTLCPLTQDSYLGDER